MAKLILDYHTCFAERETLKVQIKNGYEAKSVALQLQADALSIQLEDLEAEQRFLRSSIDVYMSERDNAQRRTKILKWTSIGLGVVAVSLGATIVIGGAVK